MELYSYEIKREAQKCAIVGCGRVGSAIAYALAQTGVFKEMVLLDIDFEKADGEAADIASGLAHQAAVDVYAGEYADLKDCGLIVLAAGTRETSREPETLLFEKKARTVCSVCKNLRIYNDRAVVLIVSSPSERLAHLALMESDFPKERVIGIGTVVESIRLKQLLGMHFAVHPQEVSVFVMGERGENAFPAWSSASVCGLALPQYCELCGRAYDRALLESFFLDVRDSEQRIADVKDAACFTIARAVKAVAVSVATDENRVFSVSTLLSGHYGIEGAYLSLPCVIGKGGIKRILELPLNGEEEERLRRSFKRARIT